MICESSNKRGRHAKKELRNSHDSVFAHTMNAAFPLKHCSLDHVAERNLLSSLDLSDAAAFSHDTMNES